MFYIQHRPDLHASHALWWRPKKAGFTYNLDDAGIYSESEALLIFKKNRHDFAWEASHVRSLANECVELNSLEQSDVRPLLDIPAPKKRPTVCPRCPQCGRVYSPRDKIPSTILCMVCR